MSKKRTKASRKNKKYSTYNLNSQLMPIANEIKGKMESLQDKYNFNLEFAFPEITMEEILKNQ